jgi:tetratricopeptide (TPR) repeat protein
MIATRPRKLSAIRLQFTGNSCDNPTNIWKRLTVSLETGDRLGRYEILGPLGAGGMGEVYRARDTELERDVAIKVLPEAVSQNPDRLARFETEAKAVAKLSHPNILDIHDYGREGDTTYSVTELLEGETLRERLEGGALGWRKATEIGAAIADGLGAAHEAGIVHRDLKPSNVFLTADGRVKVLDFGLARHEPDAGGKGETAVQTMTRQTDPGTVMGTVGYMSPEQVRGETVDQRSDIFSLGCVLFELVSGQQAFARNTAADTMAAILKEEPSDLSSIDAALPPELERTIRRCLEKRPQSRFQSASDLAYNLRTISSASAPTVTTEHAVPAPPRARKAAWIALATAAVFAIGAGLLLWVPRKEAPEQPTVAVELESVTVVPLENRTADDTLGYLGNFAADQIVERFAQVALPFEVKVAQQKPDVPSEIASSSRRIGSDSVSGAFRRKGARLLISGAYYLDNNLLRFQAQLSDPDSGEMLYAVDPATGELSRSAEVIQDLRERIVAATAAHYPQGTDIRLIRPPSTYEALQANWSAGRFFGLDYAEVIRELDRALDLDPDYRWPRINKVVAYLNTVDLENAELELKIAEEHTNQLTPFESTMVRWCRASFDVNRVGVLAESREMLRLAPETPWVRYLVGSALFRLSRPGEAVEVLPPLIYEYTPTAAPTEWWRLNLLAQSYHLLGEYDRELECANLGLERYPDVGNFFYYRSAALAAMGQVKDVRETIDECRRVQIRARTVDPGQAMVFAALELRAHGHREAGDEMAALGAEWFDRQASEVGVDERDPFGIFRHSWALRVAGRWHEANEPLLELKARGWHPIHVAGALGVIAARTGDHEEARRILSEFPDPGYPRSAADRSYWRACIAAYLGEKDRAVELLGKAFSQGRSYSLEDHIDIDLEPLWDYPPFQELIRPKG